MHCLGWARIVEWRVLARVNAALMLALVGGGLAACAIGAMVYDVGRLLAGW